MKKPLAILLLLFSLVLAQETIAVIEFEGLGISQAEAKALTNELEIYLSNLGVYRVIERGEMENILQEQGLQQTGCISSECAVEIGKLVGAQLLVSGSISKVGSIFSVTAKILDVKTGDLVKSASYKVRGQIETVSIEGMADIASQLTGKFVKPTTVIRSPTPTPVVTTQQPKAPFPSPQEPRTVQSTPAESNWRSTLFWTCVVIVIAALNIL
jgi:TolB-like protein